MEGGIDRNMMMGDDTDAYWMLAIEKDMRRGEEASRLESG